jgi:hypothetical protein
MGELSRLELYLKELEALVKDPIHKRLLAAYTGDEPKESVERELDRLLIEVLKSED